ncbi:hypothetical protein [Oceanobacillus sp. CAU 1775]
MTSFLIFVLLIIVTLIILASYSDAKKKNENMNWVATILAIIPVVLFLGFFIIVNMYGTSDDFRMYK